MTADNDRDLGPRARFEAVKADPAALGVILQRLGAGESIGQLIKSWRLPKREFREWLIAEGRRLVKLVSNNKSDQI